MTNSIVIRRRIGLGDAAFAAAAAAWLKEREPDTKIWLDTHDRRRAWLETSGLFESGAPAGAEVIDLDAIPPVDGRDRIELMAERLGAKPQPRAALRLAIPPEPHWASHVALAPYCLGYAPTRSIPQAAVDEFLERVGSPVVLLHGDTAHLYCGGVKTGAIKTTEYDAVKIVLSARAFVGVDSGLAHVAWLCGRRAIVAFTHVPAADRAGHAGPNLIALDPEGLDCWPCGDFAGRPPCWGTNGHAACARRVTADRLLLALEGPRVQEERRLDVAYFVPYTSHGGAERRAADVVRGLSGRGHSVRLFSIVEAEGFLSRALPDHYAGKTPTVETIKGRIEALKPCTIIFHQDGRVLQALAQAAHVPTNVIYERHRVDAAPLHTCTWGHRITQVVAASKASAVDDPRCRVIYSGVDPVAGPSAHLRLVPPTERVYGCIARFDPGKRLDLLIAAAPLIPNWSCVIIGDGPARDGLCELAAEAGSAFILPATDEPLPWHRRLDLLVLLSVREGGIPYTVLEATSVATPVLSTRVSELDTFYQEGRDMLFLDTVGPVSLFQAIYALDPERLRSIGEAGRRVTLQHFGLQRMLDQYETLIEGPQ